MGLLERGKGNSNWEGFLRSRIYCIATYYSSFPSFDYFYNRLNKLAMEYDLELFFPPPELCTDNGVMIAWAGIERYQCGLIDDYFFEQIPKWPIDSLG